MVCVIPSFPTVKSPVPRGRGGPLLSFRKVYEHRKIYDKEYYTLLKMFNGPCGRAYLIYLHAGIPPQSHDSVSAEFDGRDGNVSAWLLALDVLLLPVCDS